MKLVHTAAELREEITAAKVKGLTIGLVPTMGALHEGHASLISAANQENDFVVVSVFVNPTQFAPNEDLDAYPRTLEADCKLAESKGADVVFAPSPKEMYPSEDATWVEVTGDVTKVLCGRTRPIHFRGVTTVVTKLFNLAQPDRAYFGQKDAQQVEVLRRMVKDLFFPLQLRVMPIIREESGLAKSSRNTYLSDAERAAALVLSKSLKAAKEEYAAGERDAARIVAGVTESIKAEAMSNIDYVEIYALPELKPVANPMTGSNLLAVAVKFGTTRLIDNVVLEEKIMLYNMFHGKIHRATVTEACLEYMGSITIDTELLELSGIMPGERVQIVDNNNGNRLETYVIAGERGSGVICLNGAAARKVLVGDTVIIIGYAMMTEEEARTFEPKVVMVDEKNRPINVRGTELEREIG